MLIELRNGIPLHLGTFNALIGTDKEMASTLPGSNTDLQWFFVPGHKENLLSSLFAADAPRCYDGKE